MLVYNRCNCISHGNNNKTSQQAKASLPGCSVLTCAIILFVHLISDQWLVSSSSWSSSLPTSQHRYLSIITVQTQGGRPINFINFTSGKCLNFDKIQPKVSSEQIKTHVVENFPCNNFILSVCLHCIKLSLVNEARSASSDFRNFKILWGVSEGEEPFDKLPILIPKILIVSSGKAMFFFVTRFILLNTCNSN